MSSNSIQVNRVGGKIPLNPKDKQILTRGKKNDSKRNMRVFQSDLMKKALMHDSEMTAGNFAKHHNTMLRRLK